MLFVSHNYFFRHRFKYFLQFFIRRIDEITQKVVSFCSKPLYFLLNWAMDPEHISSCDLLFSSVLISKRTARELGTETNTEITARERSNAPAAVNWPLGPMIRRCNNVIVILPITSERVPPFLSSLRSWPPLAYRTQQRIPTLIVSEFFSLTPRSGWVAVHEGLMDYTAPRCRLTAL